MTLISLLFVLALDRVSTKTPRWQSITYFSYYLNMTDRYDILKQSIWGVLARIILPALILFMTLLITDSSVVTFAANVLVLFVCIGCPELRRIYGLYLQAASRKDIVACERFCEQANVPETSNQAFALHLVWQNYRHYGAVLIWFVLLGAPGVLLYIVTTHLCEHLRQTSHSYHSDVQRLLAILDFVPVRLIAFGLILVGHYSRALPVWLYHLPNPTVSAKTLIQDVAKAAEDGDTQSEDYAAEALALVELVERNVIALLVVVAVLTLADIIT